MPLISDHQRLPARSLPWLRRALPVVHALPAGVAAVVLAGCSALPSAISLGSLPSVGSLPAGDNYVADSAPTYVYANIAQKALTCWFGPKGPLKATHIFHAEAASPTTGGQAEIVLHERDLTSVHPWGQRAFRIALSALGGGTNTQVAMLNIKIPADLADALRADVISWADGRDGCQAQAVRPPPPDPVPAQAKPGPKKKPAAG